MPFSSGTFSVVYNFTTESASPPIEISKLTAQFADIATGLTSCMLRDGTGLPTADQNLNGFKFTNTAAATTLTGLPRVTELIDQDHIYYVDSGSANTLTITPSPAIAAYEEGQRFVVRAAANNSGASTLNVNGLGAFAIQTPDGAALSSGAIVIGGIYEFTYDANTAPDRWVMTSPASKVTDAMLSANVALLNAANTFTASSNGITFALTSSATVPGFMWRETAAASNSKVWRNYITSQVLSFDIADDAGTGQVVWFSAIRSGATVTQIGLAATALSLSGNVSTPGTSASEVGYQGLPVNAQAADYTTVATDQGKTIYAQTANDQVTCLANASAPIGYCFRVIANGGAPCVIVAPSGGALYLAGTAFGTTGNRTIAVGGVAFIEKFTSADWLISGVGVT